MKTDMFKADWLALVAGIALAGGGFALTKSYLGYREEVRSEAQFVGIVDQLLEECRLNRILTQAQDSGCTATAQSLDELLTANIVAVNSELALADTRTRVLAEACFQHIAHRRAQHSPTAAYGAAGRQVAPTEAVGQALASVSPSH